MTPFTFLKKKNIIKQRNFSLERINVTLLNAACFCLIHDSSEWTTVATRWQKRPLFTSTSPDLHEGVRLNLTHLEVIIFTADE